MTSWGFSHSSRPESRKFVRGRSAKALRLLKPLVKFTATLKRVSFAPKSSVATTCLPLEALRPPKKKRRCGSRGKITWCRKGMLSCSVTAAEASNHHRAETRGFRNEPRFRACRHSRKQLVIGDRIVPRVPQSQSYHRFCRPSCLDRYFEFRRCCFALALCTLGAWGLIFLFRRSSGQSFIDQRERWPPGVESLANDGAWQDIGS